MPLHGVGLGAVVAQEQEDGSVPPLAYASHSLQKHEQNYGITELEALAVVWGVKHFRPYLYGHWCDVYTDHEALKSLLNTPQPSGKLARWGMAIQELDLHIHYRPGGKNRYADALSRDPMTSLASKPTLQLATVQVGEQSAKGGDDSLAERQRKDLALLQVIQYSENGVLPEDERRAREIALTHSQYEIVDNVLYHTEKDKTLRIIPATGDRKSLFDEAHSGTLGGHLRDAKIHGQLAKHYWWPRMRADITSWCRGCLTCATRQVGQATKPSLLPIPVEGPFHRMRVDVLQLPVSANGNKYAIVFMDYLTKWPEVFPARDQSAYTIAKTLVERVIPRHGVPAQLLSDHGAAFLSKLLAEVYKLMDMKKVNTTAYHPQTNGLVEQFNRTLLDMLSKTAKRNGRDWDSCLPFVLFAYRTSPQTSTGESPFYLLYGRDPRLPTEAVLCPPPNSLLPVEADDYITELTRRMSEA